MMDVVLIGGSADLAAQPFEAPWGRVRVAAPDLASADGSHLAVFLDLHLERPDAPQAKPVVWHPAAANAGSDAFVVSRPWPVANDVFDLPDNAHDGACLVLAPNGARAEPVVERLKERQLQVTVAEGATRDLLADARIVVSLTPELPAETFAVLAAGRLLVAQATERTYGLQAWIDYLPFANEDELVQVVGTLATYPRSWAPLRALGRQSAEAHRATRAIGRLIRRVT